jgi:sulfur-carrier protein
MPTIHFTSALKRFYPALQTTHSEGATIAEILKQLDTQYAGLSDFLIDEHGTLRQHINIFIGDDMISDRDRLSDCVQEKDEVLIFQALSGG